MTEEIAARKDVLETLAASLQSERKWRNIQTVLPESFGLVAHALTAQSQVVEKLQQRIENLERALVTVATADQVAALEERIRVSTSLDQEPAATQQLKEELELRLKQEVEAMTKRICKVEENLGHEIESVQFLVNDQGSLLNSARIAEEAKWIKLQQDLALKLEVAERKMAEAKTEVAVAPVVKEISAAAPEDQEVDMVRVKSKLDFGSRTNGCVPELNLAERVTRRCSTSISGGPRRGN
ncbi:unnamed protein product [Phytophthora lilii]|uniref:Unnamed protein product n=1 Tax=Phytophthora lilii TaxID=2077276 RepID=A0A9W7CQI3_9STRA|nr:unnamed protein product [Phytophthora lilii]